MTIPEPEHVSREDLIQRLQQEVQSLSDGDLEWWTIHRVSPFVARYDESSHFIVASSGQSVIFFADDEDEFGVAKLTGGIITDCGLTGDLRDAVRIIQDT